MEQPNLDFKLGRAIGLAVKAQSARNPTRLNSLISDLLAGDLSLRSPLREIVDHQGFLKAEPLTASASSQAVVAVLLDQLGSVYRDETVARVCSVLHGYFGLTDSGEVNRQELTKFGEQTSSCDNRTAKLDALKCELGYLLQNNKWQEADRKTLQIFVESCGGNVNDTFGRIWPAVPCGLLHEINLLWSNASNFRFGFSIQRGLLESIKELDRMTVSERVPLGNKKKQFKIFADFLNRYETEEIFYQSRESSPYCLPPGYYPRCDPEFKTRTSPELEMCTKSLTANFTIVYERLVDCGITAAPLDIGSIQKLKVKFFTDQDTTKLSNKTNVSTVMSETPNQNKNIDLYQPTKSESTPKKKGGMSDKERPNPVTGVGLFLLIILSLGLAHIATPRALESCASWPNISRGICYLKEIPIDLLR